MQSGRSSSSVYLSQSGLLKAALVYALVTFALLLLAFGPAPQHQKLSASEAKDHIGETATVCGDVVSTHYAASSKGRPTFLNLDKAYPDQIFTIVIWGNNRAKFGTPDNNYKGKHVCATGEITEYRGVPKIVAETPKQIRIE